MRNVRANWNIRQNIKWFEWGVDRIKTVVPSVKKVKKSSKEQKEPL